MFLLPTISFPMFVPCWETEDSEADEGGGGTGGGGTEGWFRWRSGRLGAFSGGFEIGDSPEPVSSVGTVFVSSFWDSADGLSPSAAPSAEARDDHSAFMFVGGELQPLLAATNGSGGRTWPAVQGSSDKDYTTRRVPQTPTQAHRSAVVCCLNG